MLSEYALLPPHWSQHRDAFGNVYYYNEVTQEESQTHPYEKFLQASKTITKASATKRPSSSSRPTTTMSQSPEEFFKDVLGTNNKPSDENREVPGGESGTGKEYHYYDSSKKSSTDLLQIEYPPGSPNSNQSPLNPFEDQPEELGRDTRKSTGTGKSGGVKYDYHCQWNERDLFGKVSLYGLTIRFLENGDTLVKFDGIEGAWTYTALKGPYGTLEMADLFIGAKINVFGRHLTISSANAAACHWIHDESRRLRHQQNEFRKKIEAIGEVPCIRKKVVETVRHITRNTKTMGQTNIRQLMKENARLGEQLANLGLAQQI